MKNVLFATTALVAFAGSAMAASHGAAGTTLTWSGEVTAGYNGEVSNTIPGINNGIFFDANLDYNASVDFGDSVTASISGTLIEISEAGTVTSFMPTVEVAYTGDTLSASLVIGDLNDKGASEYFYSGNDGMAVDVENQDDSVDPDVRALIEFGSFGVAVGCGSVIDNVCNGTNVGLGATFGSIEIGVGYDEATTLVLGVLGAPDILAQRGVVGVSASAALGAVDVTVSYTSGDAVALQTLTAPAAPVAAVLAEESIGVSVGFNVSDALSVSAYYANNSVAVDGYGGSIDFATGALSIGVYYDYNVATVAGETGADISYAVSDALTAYAGFFDDGVAVDALYYAGVEYAVNDSITGTIAYSTGNEIAGPEFMQGISAFITASF